MPSLRKLPRKHSCDWLWRKELANLLFFGEVLDTHGLIMNIIDTMSSPAELLKTEFDAAVQHWIGSKDLRPNTTRAYRLEMQRLHDWVILGKKQLVVAIQAFDMLEFLEHIVLQHAVRHEGRAPTPASLQQTKRIVGAFIRHLAEDKQLPLSRSWSVEHSDVRDLVDHGVEDYESRCLAEASALSGVLLAKRAKRQSDVVINLAFWCCASALEISALKCKDVALADGTVHLAENRRTCAIPQHLIAMLSTYLAGRSAHAPVILGADKRPMPPWLISKVLRESAPESGNAPTPRRLRRAFVNLATPQALSARVLAQHIGNISIRADAAPGVISTSVWSGIAAELTAS
jgi:hypothetical protein